MENNLKKFNVRIYGFLIQNQEVLISEEIHDGEKIIKFPGGGLKLGEGTKEGLIREFKEELEVEIKIGDLVYVNDFFQNSYFKPKHQLICIYYKVNLKKEIKLISKESHLNFVWKKISTFNPNELSFKIDQEALKALKKMLKKKL